VNTVEVVADLDKNDIGGHPDEKRHGDGDDLDVGHAACLPFNSSTGKIKYSKTRKKFIGESECLLQIKSRIIGDRRRI
jgi:hypothetical protein